VTASDRDRESVREFVFVVDDLCRHWRELWRTDPSARTDPLDARLLSDLRAYKRSLDNVVGKRSPTYLRINTVFGLDSEGRAAPLTMQQAHDYLQSISRALARIVNPGGTSNSEGPGARTVTVRVPPPFTRSRAMKIGSSDEV
jgi:hypothetical protein